MKHEIDIFSEIVDRIRDVYDITSFTLVGNTYTFETESLGSMLVNDYITILGNDYIVVSTNQATYEFSVISDIDISAADFWKAKKPYFDYEKVLGESNILLEKTNSPVYRLQKYPLVFFALDQEQERDVDHLSMTDLTNVSIYIITNTENNIKYADWRLTNTMKAILIPIYELLLPAMKQHKNIFIKNNLLPHSYTERYFLGTADANQNVFNDYIDVIQLTFKTITLVNLNPECIHET